MKHAIQISALACAIVVIAAPSFPAAQAPASIKAEMVKDWSDLKATMVKIASEMPADKFAFKPTPAQQSFGERVVHVAQVNNTLPRRHRREGRRAGARRQGGRDDERRRHQGDVGFVRLRHRPAERADRSDDDAGGDAATFIGPSSRARVYTFLIGHTWDIYGQMVVYLRLSGGVPPASQRP